MKVNSSKNQNKNILLILNENKSPNLSKQNMTKTRNDAKHGFFNFNLNEQDFGKNNESRTKPKTFNYPKLNFSMQQNGDLSFNQDQNDLNSFLHKLSNGDIPNFNNNSIPNKNRQNINIIIYSPNFMVNNKNEQENNSFPVICKNDSIIPLNEKKMENRNKMDYSYKEEKKCENDISPLKKEKSLFDSNFNLIEENCGNDEVSEMLKRFAKIDLNSSMRQNSDSSNEKNKKVYTNTGDSVNCYTNRENENNLSISFNMENPYLKDS